MNILAEFVEEAEYYVSSRPVISEGNLCSLLKGVAHIKGCLEDSRVEDYADDNELLAVLLACISIATEQSPSRATTAIGQFMYAAGVADGLRRAEKG